MKATPTGHLWDSIGVGVCSLGVSLQLTSQHFAIDFFLFLLAALSWCCLCLCSRLSAFSTSDTHTHAHTRPTHLARYQWHRHWVFSVALRSGYLGFISFVSSFRFRILFAAYLCRSKGATGQRFALCHIITGSCSSRATYYLCIEIKCQKSLQAKANLIHQHLQLEIFGNFCLFFARSSLKLLNS